MNSEWPYPNDLAAPLLATRFFLPKPSTMLVLRPRLMEQLKQGLQVPLTLISAPPGFGKSSLVSHWIQNRADMSIGWLSLEPSDQEWSLFFRYLVAAWQRIFPQVGEAALGQLNDPPPIQKEMLLNLLLNDLLAALNGTRTDHVLLVLDDYHRIDTPVIHETVMYLVEHLPPRCHLILLTRADPPLPLARWRSRGLLLELRADDLRFTPNESIEYLNQCLRLGLTEEQVRILFERTEGWIVGLQMAALSLRGFKDSGKNVREFLRDFDGSNRFVLDYLIEEVVNSQPEEVQWFLMVTALLEQFCGSLCDALLNTPAPYSQRMLEHLEKSNLFLISLDDHRQWFRYHHLFAELLRVRLQQINSKQVPALYQQAAEWFFQNCLWQDAIRYSLQTKDMDFSANLFEQAILKGGLDFLYSGIGPLIEPFPSAIVQNRPLLSLAKAIAIFESSQLDGIEPLLRFAEKGILGAPAFSDQEAVLGWVYMVQSNAATLLGDHTWMIEASHQIPHWIPNDLLMKTEALLQLGNTAYYEGNFNQTDACWQQALDMSLAGNNTYYILSIYDGLARLCWQKGELNRSETFFKRGFHLLEENPGQYLRWLGAMQRDYSDLLRERNRLDEARALLETAIPLCEQWHTISGYGFGLIFMGRVLLASGDVRAAAEMLRKVNELCQMYTVYPDLETLAQVTHARLFLEEGKVERAWQVLETCLQSAYCQHGFHREWVLSAQARLLVYTGRPAEALALFGGWLESAKENGRGRDWLTMCLITALALDASGDRQKALQVLGDGLVFAQGQYFCRIFIDEGERMRALLEAFRVQFPQSPLSNYVSEIIAIFPPLPALERGHSLKIDGLYESLSSRETEILSLVCHGLSNQEIANQLVLSVGTVKFHIHNIFGKLGVRDRPQAIAKASLLGLGNKEIHPTTII